MNAFSYTLRPEVAEWLEQHVGEMLTKLDANAPATYGALFKVLEDGILSALTSVEKGPKPYHVDDVRDAFMSCAVHALACGAWLERGAGLARMPMND